MFQLPIDEAEKLLASYRAEIQNQRKNLDAVVSLAFLLEKYIDEFKSSVSHEQN